MLYFTANKLTIKPCLKHLANELHLFECYVQCYPNSVIERTFLLYCKKNLNKMNGKIKLKLNQKSSIKNRIYEVFIDENFIGNVDYKNPKLDFVTTLGNHKILVKENDFEKEQNFVLSSRKLILPIEINENFLWTKQSAELPKIMNGIIIGFLLVYAFIITYLLYTKQIEFMYPLIFPFFILLFTNSFLKNNQRFQLNFK